MRPLPWLLLLLAAAAPAQVPRTLGVQGRVEDPVGVPASGMATVTVRLHDALSGGTTDFSETDLVSFASGGVFSTVIGDGTTLPVEIFSEPRWVSFEVDGVLLEPRQPLTAAPYALRASPASRLTRVVAPVLVAGVLDPAASGAALEAALDGITDASATQPYRVLLEPGVYQLSAPRTLPTSVRIVGAGPGTTVLRAGGTLTSGDASALEGLTVELDPGTTTGFQVGAGTSLELHRVEITGDFTSAGTYRALDVSGEARLRGCAIRMTGIGGGTLQGLYGQGVGAVIDLLDTDIEATGSSWVAGVDSIAGEVRVRGGRVEVDAAGEAWGLFQSANGDFFDVRDTHLVARSSGSNAYGVHATGNRVSLTGCYATVSGANAVTAFHVSPLRTGVVSGCTADIDQAGATTSNLTGILFGGGDAGTVSGCAVRIRQSASSPAIRGIDLGGGNHVLEGGTVDVEAGALGGGTAYGIYASSRAVVTGTKVDLLITGGPAVAANFSASDNSVSGAYLRAQSVDLGATGIVAFDELRVAGTALRVLAEQEAVGIETHRDATVSGCSLDVQAFGSGADAIGVRADPNLNEVVVVAATRIQLLSSSGTPYYGDNVDGPSTPDMVFLGCIRRGGVEGEDPNVVNSY